MTAVVQMAPKQDVEFFRRGHVSVVVDDDGLGTIRCEHCSRPAYVDRKTNFMVFVSMFVMFSNRHVSCRRREVQHVAHS